MHWFWRAAIAVTVGVLYAIHTPVMPQEVYSRWADAWRALSGISLGHYYHSRVAVLIVSVAPFVLVMLAT